MRSVSSSLSITAFRTCLSSLLEHEARDKRRNIVVLGLDGIPYSLALELWPRAQTAKLVSVFPTTSSSAWLSSLSGLDVGSHGIPGVVFMIPGSGLTNVFQYCGTSLDVSLENVFGDAKKFGYEPFAILGDLMGVDCAWRDILLRGSRYVIGQPFYADTASRLEPGIICARIGAQVSGVLEEWRGRGPVLAWCLVDVDRHIHRHGYDEHVATLLQLVDELAVTLASRGAVVVAHSDHALVPTRHVSEVEGLLEDSVMQYNCAIGGAGRVRWIYARPEVHDRVMSRLECLLPDSIEIVNADDAFGRGSLARGRVGDIVLVAQRDEFVSLPGYCYDHGSQLDAELEVPMSMWQD